MVMFYGAVDVLNAIELVELIDKTRTFFASETETSVGVVVGTSSKLRNP